MTKEQNQVVASSCWNKAGNNEHMFILLERDRAAPVAIRTWVQERIRLGLNKETDLQIKSAVDLADYIERKLS